MKIKVNRAFYPEHAPKTLVEQGAYEVVVYPASQSQMVPIFYKGWVVTLTKQEVSENGAFECS